MSNLLDRFKKQVVGSDFSIFDYVATVSSGGDFKRIINIDVIINSWNNILLTPRGTYLHDPEYGSDLHLLIFDPVDENTVEKIKTEIERRLYYYDDRATITDITVFLMPNGKGFSVDIEVTYEGDEKTLSVQFDDTNSIIT